MNKTNTNTNLTLKPDFVSRSMERLCNTKMSELCCTADDDRATSFMWKSFKDLYGLSKESFTYMTYSDAVRIYECAYKIDEDISAPIRKRFDFYMDCMYEFYHLRKKNQVFELFDSMSVLTYCDYCLSMNYFTQEEMSDFREAVISRPVRMSVERDTTISELLAVCHRVIRKLTSPLTDADIYSYERHNAYFIIYMILVKPFVALGKQNYKDFRSLVEKYLCRDYA